MSGWGLVCRVEKTNEKKGAKKVISKVWLRRGGGNKAADRPFGLFRINVPAFGRNNARRQVLPATSSS
jgi:hypothetical protein